MATVPLPDRASSGNFASRPGTCSGPSGPVRLTRWPRWPIVPRSAARPGPVPTERGAARGGPPVRLRQLGPAQAALAVIERYTRFPPTDPGGAAGRPAAAEPRAAEDGADLADGFLRLACLWYEDDQPARWAAARSCWRRTRN